MNNYKVKRKFLSLDNLQDQVKIHFFSQTNLSKQSSRDTISDTKTEINFKDVQKDFNYYHIIRRVLYPFALTGAPIGFCLEEPEKHIKIWSLYGLLNVNLTYLIF